MEGHCSKGQSPQWAVVPMEEEAEDHFEVRPRLLENFCTPAIGNSKQQSQVQAL